MHVVLQLSSLKFYGLLNVSNAAVSFIHPHYPRRFHWCQKIAQCSRVIAQKDNEFMREGLCRNYLPFPDMKRCSCGCRERERNFIPQFTGQVGMFQCWNKGSNISVLCVPRKFCMNQNINIHARYYRGSSGIKQCFVSRGIHAMHYVFRDPVNLVDHSNVFFIRDPSIYINNQVYVSSCQLTVKYSL